MSVVAVQLNSPFRRDAPLHHAGDVIRPAFANSRVRVNWPNSYWFKKLQNRLNQLTSLRQGWDGYNGKPVSFNCATFATSVLEKVFNESVDAPSLIPGSDGSIQIEWHLNGYDIELDILAPFEVVAMRYDHRSDLTEEFNLTEDFTIVSDWISDLSVEREPAEAAKS